MTTVDPSAQAAAARAAAAFDSAPPDATATEAEDHPHAAPPQRQLNIDATNDFMVTPGTADNTVIFGTPDAFAHDVPLNRGQALRLAAWLVATADLVHEGHAHFREILEVVDDLIEPSTPPSN